MADKQSLLDEAERQLAAGKLNEALALFKRAFLLDTGDLGVREWVADLLAFKGKKEQAIHEYRLIASAQAQGGALLEAIALCKKILQLDPEHRATQQALAQLYALNGGARLRPSSVGDKATGGPEPTAVSEELPAVPPLAGEAELPPLTLRTDMPLLPRMPVFSDLSPEAFVFLVERLKVRKTSAGELVLHEGDTDDRSMHIVVRGRYAVIRERDRSAGNSPLARLGPGAFFGEMALVARIPRLCSVYAEEDGQLLRLDEQGFRDIEQRYPAAARAVVKTFKERLAADLATSSPIFRALPQAAKQMLVEHNEVLTIGAGQDILEDGQRGTGLYLLLRGQCDVLKTNRGASDERRYAILIEGDVFGEISALTNSPCTATVRTRDECVVLRVPHRALSELVKVSPQAIQLMLHVANRRLKRTIRLTETLA